MRKYLHYLHHSTLCKIEFKIKAKVVEVFYQGGEITPTSKQISPTIDP
jgi:hypothetical protein